MLLDRATLERLAAEPTVVVYRRWREPRVAAGSSFKSAAGVVSVVRVERASVAALTEGAARRAGYPSLAALRAELARYPDGTLYRISLRRAGPDPRVALRAQARLADAEVEALREKLARLGASSADGPWALPALRLIASRPAVRAPDLAAALGMETLRFKARVRQLKELGLTESLDVGYRLSPRGRALLRRLGREPRGPSRATPRGRSPG